VSLLPVDVGLEDDVVAPQAMDVGEGTLGILEKEVAAVVGVL